MSVAADTGRERERRSGAPIRVVVVEAQAVTREGVAALLGAADGIDLLGMAATPEEVARFKTVEVVVVCATVFNREAIRNVVSCVAPARVVLLGDIPWGEVIRPALRAGAHGFVSLRTVQAVPTAIRAVHQGLLHMSPSVTNTFLRTLLPAGAGGQDNTSTDLTPREREVLSLLGRGQTSREIARRLTISVKTVHTHRMRMMAKLGVHNFGMLVRRGIESGLIDV